MPYNITNPIIIKPLRKAMIRFPLNSEILHETAKN